jgi:hypothetical protein
VVGLVEREPTPGITSAPGLERATASTRSQKLRAVDESLTQLGETFLSFLLTLVFERAEPGAAVSGGGRGGIRGGCLLIVFDLRGVTSASCCCGHCHFSQ